MQRTTLLRGILRCFVVAIVFAVAACAVQLNRAQTQPSAQPPSPKEATVDEPLPPLEAARTMQVPEGFQVTLFAGEPDVKQPIGFAIDDRGRLWVAEAYNYPVHGTKAGDRIVILEDTDGDGRHDKRTVFYDGLNYVTGIEVGFGGAWVMSPPYFYFIPDRNGDDKPDDKPQVLLDGFGNHANSHNLANGFAWGPDGWLYGTHGRTNWSLIGKPGTPEKERERFDGGVYRYHPTRHVWEPYADGTTNPWGIDWNDYGEAFITNCVNPHLFHVIYGAHYEPWRNRESSQYAYQRIDTIADHLHFVGAWNVRDGLNSSAEDQAGGGHAHCGLMIYQGDNWPEQYRNTLFTNNIHGRRINNDILKRSGSGYTASHGKDLMRSKDPWFMGVTLQYGPDGSVFVIDWSDTGECHSVRNTRRETGRIYKISYGKPKPFSGNIAKLSDADLVKLQTHHNDWFVRHARRVLQERAAAKQDLSSAVNDLRATFEQQTNIPQKLRSLWTLQALEQWEIEDFIRLLRYEDEYVRGWAVRLLCEEPELSQSALERLALAARDDESPLVRMHIASNLQRLKLAGRWNIATALLSHDKDAKDENIPLLVWYAVEPLVTVDPQRFVALAGEAKLPLVARFIARRAASLPDSKSELAALVKMLSSTKGEVQKELLAGIIDGLAGRRTVAMPETWPNAYASLKVVNSDSLVEKALQLALIFDDPRALADLRAQAKDPKVAAAIRNRAIQALVAKKAKGLDAELLELIGDTPVAKAALRGLAEFEHAGTATAILSQYSKLEPNTRQDALQTLASRAAWALPLVAALEKNEVPRADVTAYTARQMFTLNNEELTTRLKAAWGELRTSPAEKQQQIASFKKRFTLDAIQKSDRSAGRAIFQKTCANCHTIFGTGGKIGPDITGSQRTNLDYLLHTLIDPSAAVNKDYQMHVIQTVDGRTITGLIAEESKTALTMQTVNEKIIIPADEIEERKLSPVSMMPDGLLQNLSNDQVRQLLAYLMGPDQAPLPK
ncbi:PVC-type heme-binding CxxCH protein [Anatilimnocola floriformis]|uniref:PVC-type heme-binding CxxCH protein n=1 Tax=Anatilimnocola floriformis TaxID=2948575 RepID=UPI0020C3F03C|nr:PVC-type heme-binding CxxCH protein [Anatilimnocola floriformis]